MASKTLLVVAIVLALAASPLACPTNNRVNNAVFNGISFWGAYQCIALSACAQFATFGQVTGNCPSNSDYWCWVAQTSYSVFCAAATTGRRDEEQDGRFNEKLLHSHTLTYIYDEETPEGRYDRISFSETVKAEIPESFDDYKKVVAAIVAKVLTGLEANVRNRIVGVSFVFPPHAFEFFDGEMDKLMAEGAILGLAHESGLFSAEAFAPTEGNKFTEGGPKGWGFGDDSHSIQKVRPWDEALWCPKDEKCEWRGDCPSNAENQPPKMRPNCDWKYEPFEMIKANFLSSQTYVNFRATQEAAAHAKQFNPHLIESWKYFLEHWAAKGEDCGRKCKRNATNTF